jgi:exodeoxyribonuclease VII small subunit
LPCAETEEKISRLKMKFEDNLKKLESLVSKMVAGELGLDEMIVAFEEGRKLADECQKSLESIRLRIEKVTRTGAVEPMEA